MDQFVQPELLMMLAGALSSLLTQISKRWFNGTNPMVIVAVLSLLGGVAYVAMKQSGVDIEGVIESVGIVFATAVTIYNVLKQFVKVK